MGASKPISARKLAVLYLLGAPDSEGTEPSLIEGTTRLQKLLFLVQDRHKGSLDPKVWDLNFAYVPEKFGPADLELYQDLDFLEALGHLTTGRAVHVGEGELLSWAVQEDTGTLSFPEEREEEELSFEYLMSGSMDEALQERSTVEKSYSITVKGREFLSRLESRAGGIQESGLSKLRDACRSIKLEYGSYPLKRLLEFVYRNYPDMITESTIRERVLRGS